jgi:hypothetical protein
MAKLALAFFLSSILLAGSARAGLTQEFTASPSPASSLDIEVDCGGVATLALGLSLTAIGRDLELDVDDVPKWTHAPSIWVDKSLTVLIERTRLSALYQAAGFPAPKFVSSPQRADVRVYSFSDRVGGTQSYAFARKGSKSLGDMRSKAASVPANSRKYGLVPFEIPVTYPNAGNVDGTLSVSPKGEIAGAECFVKLTQSMSERDFLLQECVVRSLGFSGRASDLGPRLLRPRAIGRYSEVTDADWREALSCVRLGYGA